MSLTFRELGDNHREILIGLYRASPEPLDSLPYSDAFERLYSSFVLNTRLPIDRTNVWKSLCALRKTKKLKRKV